jgi:hypothetical protein
MSLLKLLCLAVVPVVSACLLLDLVLFKKGLEGFEQWHRVNASITKQRTMTAGSKGAGKSMYWTSVDYFYLWQGQVFEGKNYAIVAPVFSSEEDPSNPARSCWQCELRLEDYQRKRNFLCGAVLATALFGLFFSQQQSQKPQ